TVTAAVFERIRDFGIKRALGATDLDLLGEVLGEGLRVSLWGGAAGVLLALAIGTAVDSRLLRDGQQLFLFSPRLLRFALLFSAPSPRATPRCASRASRPPRRSVGAPDHPPRSGAQEDVCGSRRSPRARPRGNRSGDLERGIRGSGGLVGLRQDHSPQSAGAAR